MGNIHNFNIRGDLIMVKTDQCIKALIIHHDDMDGIVGAKIIQNYLIDNNLFPRDKISLYEASYSKDFDIDEQIKMGTFIFVVDFTIPLEKLDKWIDEGKTKVSNMVWLDHHISSIRTYTNYPEFTRIHGLRIPYGFCGAELAYIYLFMNIEQRNDHEIVYNGKTYDLSDEKDAKYIRRQFPVSLKAVGDWDTWRHVNDKDSLGLEMNYGFAATAPDVSDDSEFWEIFYTNNITLEDFFLDNIIEAGEAINEYNKKKYAKLVKNNAYEAVAVWYPAGCRELPYKIIALNSSERTSMVFETVKNQYELGVVFSYNEYGTTYSIYRLGLNPDKDIDCSYIAKTYGGGGHHNAAGWFIKSREVLFLPKVDK